MINSDLKKYITFAGNPQEALVFVRFPNMLGDTLLDQFVRLRIFFPTSGSASIDR